MFKKGTYRFNHDANFNFQLNRVVMWGGGDPAEIESVADTITDSGSWVDALTKLAEKAQKDGNTDRQIGYLRMSEFFMYDSDPMKLKTYKRAKDLFYEYNADRIKENGITVGSVPYAGGYLPVMVCKCSKDCRGRILLHGGNDSYYRGIL